MIDIDELRIAIRRLERHQKIYKALKEELLKRGYWKQLPRGKPRRFK